MNLINRAKDKIVRTKNKAIDDLLNMYLGSKGRIMLESQNKDKVVALINKLRPYKTEHELIRIGPKGDGGYLVPNDLEGIEACFSPGVGPVSDFEVDCEKLGMKVFLADASVKKPNLNIHPDNYDFISKFIGCTNNTTFVTLDDWVNSFEIKEDADLLLQMDIESGEYFSLINTSDELMKKFRIIVIEFHLLDRLWDTYFFQLAETVLDKILQTHSCVHNHPNNCCGIDKKFGVDIPRVIELTFLRNDRADFKEFATEFPHPLDFDNTKKDHIVLPKNWFGVQS